MFWRISVTMIFSEKINYAFGEQLGLNWYICRNDVHCNDLSELESVLRFLADWPENQDVLLIGLGNEGVLQLTAFLHQVSKCSSKCWLMPVSVQALRQGLYQVSQFSKHSMQPCI